jgi:cell wall-associated NlpC family hydrolase
VTQAPDPNVNAYRPDVASVRLRGVVAADRYADGELWQARSGTVPLRDAPDDGARQVSELLFGEDFVVYDTRDGWVWGQCAADDYVGYARAGDLHPEPLGPTHKIGALRAHVFSEPDLKSPPLDQISLGSRVTVVEHSGDYAGLSGGGWLHRVTVAPVDATEPDFVETALRFMGVAYLWGGRSSLGLDCSGLAQIALTEAGIACPRDSYMQEEAVGEPAALDGPYRRGDLVIFPDHCGLMVDATVMVHANATAMCVSRDPLPKVVGIVKGQSDGVGITGVRRIAAP